MKYNASIVSGLVVGLFLFGGRVDAQQHRATRLGAPATRFAPPLVTREDLRSRFRDEKLRPDIASILNQWGWKGDVEDLHRAALSAEISEIKIPVGTRMPFMSSREGGKPITLRDVLWAGEEPISAFAFNFASKGQRYRCVTPKPCSNFFLEDLGPDQARLQMVKTSPVETSLCAPFEVKVTLRNLSTAVATHVTVTDMLPAGLTTGDHQSSVTVDVGTVPPMGTRDVRFQVMAAAAGTYVNTAQATWAGGGSALATSRTVVGAPALELSCVAPSRVLMTRPLEVCLTVRNSGKVTEPKATVILPIPEGAVVTRMTGVGSSADGRVSWEIPNLAAGASQKLCAVFSVRRPVSLAFSPQVSGVCAPPAQSACATEVLGVPAILLEVIDLEDPVEVGKEVTYVIKVTNQGYASGTNIRMVCTLPASQEFVSGEGITPVLASGATLTMDALPRLEPKAEASWRVVVKAARADDARFRAELSSDQFERPIHEDESTRQY